MKTKLIQLRCPACNAQLVIEDDLDTLFCKYCGEKIIIDNNTRLNAKVQIKKYEHEEQMQRDSLEFNKYQIEKKFEQEEKREKRKDREIWKSLLMLALCGLFIGAPLGIMAYNDHLEIKRLREIEQKVEEYYIEGKYDAALLKANQLVYSGGWSSSEPWDQKRKAWVELIEKTIDEQK